MAQRITLIILAGGRGIRYQSKAPKQFSVLNGTTSVFIQSIRPFLNACKGTLESILVVCPALYKHRTEIELKEKLKTKIPVAVITGGERRIDSFFLAISHLIEHRSSTDIVLVHDAVRPLIDPSDIKGLLQYFNENRLDAGVLIKPLSESLFKKKRNQIVGINREAYVFGETPDIFTLSLLIYVYKKWMGKIRRLHSALDIMELISLDKKFRVGGYEGKHPNTKLTHPNDAYIIKSHYATQKHTAQNRG